MPPKTSLTAKDVQTLVEGSYRGNLPKTISGPKPPERRPYKVPPESLEGYREALAGIIASGDADWEALVKKERLKTSATSGRSMRMRIEALRKALGVDPWPRGVDLMEGY